MKTVKLICPDCKELHGCQQFLRWGNNFHYCGLCPEKELCLLKHKEVHAEINEDFRCITCINPQKRDKQKDIDCEKFYKEDKEHSEFWHTMADRYAHESSGHTK